jgi:phenylacetate-CoA ligase
VPTLYLEAWLHDIIRQKLEADEGFRRFIKTDRLNHVSRSDVDAYQLFLLRQTLHYAYANSSYYHELFDKNGVRPEDLHGLKDLSLFPLTDPGQLAETPNRFLCTSQSQIARPYTFVTSGTTGPQKRIFWTHYDLEQIIDFMAAGIGTVATCRDVVQIVLPDGRPYSQADLLCRGVQKLGATPVVASIDLSAEEQLRIIENSRSTVVFGYANRIYRISQELRANHDLSTKGVKCLFLAAEYLPAAMRRELQALWNCPVHTHYGLTEMGLGVAIECEARDGYHFNEADLLVEVVSPRTGKAVDAGIEGELVFTTLRREAMPLIRYRTHDLSRLMVEPCLCGAASLQKIDKVKKRLETIVVIGNGDEMYPALFDDVLFEVPGLIDYQVTLTREDNKDLLCFKIEMIPGYQDRVLEIHRILLSTPIIAGNIAAGRMVHPAVELVGWEALKSVSRAKKMIVDRR